VLESSDISGKQKGLGRSKPSHEVANKSTAASSDDTIQAFHSIQAIWPYASGSPTAMSTLESSSLFSITVEPQYAAQSEQD